MRDAGHLAHVRTLACLGCQVRPAGVAHHRHAEPGNMKGMAQKAGDDTVVPLCPSCHNRYHRQHVVGALDRAETIALFEKTRAELWAARVEQRRGR